jgi:DNA-binding beta-propeller fold protein YncE
MLRASRMRPRLNPPWKSQIKARTSRIALLFLLAGIGAGVLASGGRMETRLRGLAPLAGLRPTGAAQLVSVQPLPQINIETNPEMAGDGEMCQWVPANASSELAVVLGQETLGTRADSKAGAVGRPSVALERPPLRVIRDSFPTYSAVAVDIQNNEVVLQDENLFQIMVYDRMTNTPPAASLSEPKRVIGGPDTKAEFNCGLYIDPETGDIYSVNNDTLDTMTVFSRAARGNVRPDRELHTAHRTYGIAVDEASQELFLAIQDPPMVTVYRKKAAGEEKPIRVLRGNHTGLADAHGIGLDTRNGWMFVANYGGTSSYEDGGGNSLGTGTSVATLGAAMTPGSGRFQPPSITVFAIQAKGDAPPLRTISGPNTLLNWPAHVFVDEQHGEVFVANDGDNSILVFRATDSGNVAPTRVIQGPKTQIQNPTGIFVDTVHDEVVVANMGNHSATVYRRSAYGDTPPLRTIRNAPLGKRALMIGNPGSLAYDTKRDAIITPN